MKNSFSFTLIDLITKVINFIYETIMRISESGGQAKMMVDDGIVFRNGEPEFRKRAKLRSGDLIEVMDFKIRVV